MTPYHLPVPFHTNPRAAYIAKISSFTNPGQLNNKSALSSIRQSTSTVCEFENQLQNKSLLTFQKWFGHQKSMLNPKNVVKTFFNQSLKKITFLKKKAF
jgi:hypothetical protein